MQWNILHHIEPYKIIMIPTGPHGMEPFGTKPDNDVPHRILQTIWICVTMSDCRGQYRNLWEQTNLILKSPSVCHSFFHSVFHSFLSNFPQRY